jgi:hypothetical protein
MNPVPASLDGSNNDPLIGNAVTDDVPPADGLTDTKPPMDGFCYSPEDMAILQSIETEAAALFPVGKVYASPVELREAVRSFAYKKGFEITTGSWKVMCSRCDEPKSYKNKREKRIASGVVPVEKQRTRRSSTRCGCPFTISYSQLQSNDKTHMVTKITRNCVYKHDKGCRPSRSQLAVEKRKAGSYTRSVNESKMNTIIALLETEEKVPVRIMRKLIRPLFPPGHSLDYQLLRNVRLKAERMIAKKGTGDVNATTITQEEEST